MAQLAGFAVLMLGAQAQFHAATQPGVQVDLPVAQVQPPFQGHALLVLTAVHQLPVQQPRPTVGRPQVFAGMTAIPGPAHRHTTPDRPNLRPLFGAPQPRPFTRWLKVQQLRALAAEHRLATGVIDDQDIALLITLPLECRPGPLRGEEAMERMFGHGSELLLFEIALSRPIPDNH
ncbi:hypothetical protein D3C79_751220 [compost metagenome]